MSYTITLSNGNTLAVVADQSFDKVSSSITLIGKNVNAYGQYVNENFVQLLENFANIAAPSNPISGQLWYDTSVQRLKVYSGALSDFKPVGSPVIFASSTPIEKEPNAEPPGSVQGDLWWNPTLKELRYLDGTTWYKTSEQFNPLGKGQSGWFVEYQKDGLNDNAVSALYNAGTLLAVATDVQLTLNQGNPYVPFLGTTTLYPGITLNPSYTIYGTATNATNWSNLSTSSFIQKNVYEQTTGAIDIKNNAGLGIGTQTNMKLLVEDTGSVATSVIWVANPNENFQLRYNWFDGGTGNGVAPAISLIGTASARMGIFTDNPQTTLDIHGDTLVRGNLTVIGTTTNIKTSILEVNSASIILAYGNNLDLVADGGGITLEGTTPKTLVWYSTTTAWTSSENLDLAQNRSYKIGGVDVLTTNSLGTGTHFAPGLQALPALTSFTASYFILAGTDTTFVQGRIHADVQAGSDLYIDSRNQRISLNDSIAHPGIPNVIIGSSAADMTNYNLGSFFPNMLVSKDYVDNLVVDISSSTAIRKTFTITMDITPVYNSPDSDINKFIIGYLNKMLPIDGKIGGTDPYRDSQFYKLPINTRCNVLAQYYTGTYQTFTLSLNKTTVLVDKGGAQNSQSVLQDVAATGTNIGSIFTPIVSHLIKTFYVLDDGTGNNNTWTFVANIL